MDRRTIFYGQVPLETDLLYAQQYAMTALAQMAQSTLGTNTIADGFTLQPTAPATMNVTLGPGTVYAQQNLEASAWSSLGVDTHVIMKQGIALDPQTFTVTAPTTVGYAQSFLVEVNYQDADGGQQVRPYYNAANPTVPFQGPGNAGTADNTVRKGAVAVQLKAGVAASSGNQLPPAPDAGWAGLFVINVAYGQTTITAGNITLYNGGAGFIPVKLPGVPAGVQAGQWLYGGTSTSSAGNGGSTVFNVTLAPVPASFPIGMTFRAKMNAAPTGNDTIVINGTTFSIVQNLGGAATVGGEWSAGDVTTFIVRSANQVQLAAAGVSSSSVANYVTNNYAKGSLINTVTITATGTYTATPGTRYVRLRITGGGGAGGSPAPTGAAPQYGMGAGGAGGGTAYGTVNSGFSGITVTIGGGGTANSGSGGVFAGNSGGTSSFGSFMSASGGAGGAASIAGISGSAVQSGGVGGVGIGGNIANTHGEAGANSVGNNPGNVASGAGGGTFWGFGGSCVFSSTTPGIAGVDYGSGGSGGVAQSNVPGTTLGGAGASGICVIEEYA